MDMELEARALTMLDEALEQPASQRERWLADRCGEDAALQRRVAAMLRMEEAPSIRTGTAPLLAVDEELPDRIGAYRITGLIGQGGMGAVYRGERAAGDFEHVAAVKLIRPGALSEELVERFRRERQTLARLAHPHIARLYDGGETGTGQPYLVMECVDGQPLGAWLDQERPATGQRLDLFRKVCTAVAYAHRNLIIHRDLTPANILVDKGGEPKLIDFGIARPADEQGGDAPAQTATPGFAPPERLAGAPATTLTDIFALGRLLDLLIGNERDADLVAIVARASATDPGRRYATVEGLIDDLDRYLDGRPVEARGGGAIYRTRRFVRRHRLPVAAASFALLLLIGALLVTTIANRRAQLARQETERRFGQTRAIANTLLFPAFDEVRKASGGTRAQVLLAETGLRYLDALAADASAPFDVRLEVGRGYTRLAQVIGGGDGAQLGKLTDGNRLLTRAEALLTQTRAERPDSGAARRAFAQLRLEQAAINMTANNRPALALTQAREAEALLRPDARASAAGARDYAAALQARGEALGWANDYAAAKPEHLKAEGFIASLPQAWRDAPPLMQVRAANLRLLGESYHKLKDKDAAQHTLDRAVEANRAILAKGGDDPLAQRRLIQALWYRAVVHRTNYRDALAAESIGEALQRARGLRDRDPSDAGALRLFALVGEVQAQVFGDVGRHADSERIGDEVIAAHRRLVSLAGDPAGARRSLAQALRTSGGNFYNAKAYAKACARWREALDIFEDAERRGELLERDRTNSMPEMQRFLAKGCNPPRPGLEGEF
ncbi:serine/threonine protein kinase [Sphingomonas sp. ID1715]|uniref:serine/threonine-protein kinase n=1 Tax=Sphingomonas sp. ID1715 TaxID=1656898 RepID=UPI001489767D|nr:serine/threonine-protein kinase [Sphingomonas sp. ID1715]NNM76798.1 serine/threonine protein kinase [Sphingomonas sp. ID1715]